MCQYKMASVVSVQPDARMVKTSFRSFRSIFDQNTLLKTSRTKRKCAEIGEISPRFQRSRRDLAIMFVSF